MILYLYIFILVHGNKVCVLCGYENIFNSLIALNVYTAVVCLIHDWDYDNISKMKVYSSPGIGSVIFKTLHMHFTVPMLSHQCSASVRGA